MKSVVEYVIKAEECLSKAEEIGPGVAHVGVFWHDRAYVYATLALAVATAGPQPEPDQTGPLAFDPDA